ncbi:hypothetical protein SAMN05216266_101193 [Amycolatopsis marina]|uniref:Uncharacterized protein n=1 Tax=Amycolatopsis marina TaxID=490629 RepID=A0A1I0VE68_9PSEU|nr:hypothetical protein SAMN05216266_101193 [Amycolatopsis marina]
MVELRTSQPCVKKSRDGVVTNGRYPYDNECCGPGDHAVQNACEPAGPAHECPNAVSTCVQGRHEKWRETRCQTTTALPVPALQPAVSTIPASRAGAERPDAAVRWTPTAVSASPRSSHAAQVSPATRRLRPRPHPRRPPGPRALPHPRHRRLQRHRLRLRPTPGRYARHGHRGRLEKASPHRAAIRCRPAALPPPRRAGRCRPLIAARFSREPRWADGSRGPPTCRPPVTVSPPRRPGRSGRPRRYRRPRSSQLHRHRRLPPPRR